MKKAPKGAFFIEVFRLNFRTLIKAAIYLAELVEPFLDAIWTIFI